MSAVNRLDIQERIKRDLPGAIGQTGDEAGADRFAAVESALYDMRQEFAEMRDMLVERERKGAMLVDAYKQVLADMADLFEAQRHENIKREESIRFFLNSIESRLINDLKTELGLGGGDGKRRGGWPSRRSGR